jgi:hypothetical protein
MTTLLIPLYNRVIPAEPPAGGLKRLSVSHLFLIVFPKTTGLTPSKPTF